MCGHRRRGRGARRGSGKPMRCGSACIVLTLLRLICISSCGHSEENELDRRRLIFSVSFTLPAAFWTLPASCSPLPSTCSLASPTNLPTACFIEPTNCLAAPTNLSLSMSFAALLCCRRRRGRIWPQERRGSLDWLLASLGFLRLAIASAAIFGQCRSP